MNKKTKSQV